MYFHQRKAFTMLELTFVIVIIGILSAIAIPKFAMTADDAVTTKAKNTVTAVRNAIATERQKRILRGSFIDIAELSSDIGVDKDIFDGFDGNITNSVLTYPLRSCKNATTQGCWINVGGSGTTANPTVYTYRMPVSGTVTFSLAQNLFTCNETAAAPEGENCKLLTR